MLSNLDILEITEYYNLPLIDVEMKDKLRGKPKDGAYIVNLQSSNVGNGTHWCMFYVNRKEVVYFDPFGVLPPLEVEKFIKKIKGVHLYYNEFNIQDLKSEMCGWFCIACIHYIHNNIKHDDLYNVFNRFINGFSCNTKENDSILKSYFKKYEKVDGKMPLIMRKLLKYK